MVVKTVQSDSESYAFQLINQIVSEHIAGHPSTYEALTAVQKDAEGNITAITTNVANINRIQTDITNILSGKLSENTYFDVKIPIGNLLNDEFFSGRGPAVTVRVVVSEVVKSDIENEFIEAGINQTLHRIKLVISIKYTLLLPMHEYDIVMKTAVSISETVIVGKVPDAYTNINRFDVNEETIDDIVDFGAEVVS